jgi:hypothetical protein
MSQVVTLNYVQAGRGRLGQKIADAWQESDCSAQPNSTPVFARVDQEHGLAFEFLTKKPEDKVLIKLLVICISSGRPQKWQWQDIFGGLARQVVSGQIEIARVIYISSTRVYDGIESGLVHAGVTPVASSERARQLIVAEEQVCRLSQSVDIIRCAGLYGDGYSVYTEKLKEFSTRVRFAVTLSQVIDEVAGLFNSQAKGCHYSLLTDGFAYLEGAKIDLAEANRLQVAVISETHKILINSRY